MCQRTTDRVASAACWKRLDEVGRAEKHDRPLFLRQRPEWLALEWRDEVEGKGSTDEALSLLRGAAPHVKPGTKVTPIAGAIDLLPTLADLAGIAIVSAEPLDGVSVAAAAGQSRQLAGPAHLHPLGRECERKDSASRTPRAISTT